MVINMELFLALPQKTPPPLNPLPPREGIIPSPFMGEVAASKKRTEEVNKTLVFTLYVIATLTPFARDDKRERLFPARFASGRPFMSNQKAPVSKDNNLAKRNPQLTKLY